MQYNPPVKSMPRKQTVSVDVPDYANLPFLEYKTRQNGIINLTYFPTLQLNEITKRIYSNTVSVNTPNHFGNKNEQSPIVSPSIMAAENASNTHHKCISKAFFSLKHMYNMM